MIVVAFCTYPHLIVVYICIVYDSRSVLHPPPPYGHLQLQVHSCVNYSVLFLRPPQYHLHFRAHGCDNNCSVLHLLLSQYCLRLQAHRCDNNCPRYSPG